jgi:hypothetical protein
MPIQIITRQIWASLGGFDSVSRDPTKWLLKAKQGNT